MSALASYLRTLIVGYVVLLADRFGLPTDGLGETAEEIALLVVGTLTWVVTKYGPQALPGWLKGKSGLFFLLLAVVSLAASACTLPGGWGIQVVTPYVDAHSGPDGTLTIIPKPIVLPEK